MVKYLRRLFSEMHETNETENVNDLIQKELHKWQEKYMGGR